MSGRDRLFLHEEIMLLALRDEKGTVASGTMYGYGLGGAILAELLLAERIRVVTPKKTPLVELVSSQRVGDPVIDECLDKIRDAKKRASLQTWVSRFVNIKHLKHRSQAYDVDRNPRQAESKPHTYGIGGSHG